MPTNLFYRASRNIPHSNLKRLSLVGFLLLAPLLFHAQSLTGLWTGALRNDSSTVRKDQSFEIALTEYRGKVYGYSRSEFIVNDTLYYVVKRVKGTIEGDICEVIDDEIIAYNFRGKLDKGIKVTSTFRRNKTDSSWYLAGTWKTNATKKYYSVTGKVDLEEEKDLTASKIFPHLEELKLADDVAFYKDRKEGVPIVRIAKPEKIKPVYNGIAEQVSLDNDITLTTRAPILQRAEAEPVPEVKEEILVIKKPEALVSRTETKNIPEASVSITPTVTTKTIAKNKVPETIVQPADPVTSIASNTNPEKKQPVTDAPGKITKQDPPVIAKQSPVKDIAKNTTAPSTAVPVKSSAEVKKPEIASATVAKTSPPVTPAVPEKKETLTAPPVVKATPEIKKPEVDVTTKAAVIAGRKSEFSQVVNFKSDSLILSLYDNGEIDGDTVSVFLNGEVLMSHQGLKASAIKKTIYISPGNEDFSLVLFAENLGKYPPNTGLLVVRDGDEVYNLRFSSDFQKNAGIVFRRKK
ncbi:MAG: hypothetical protein ABIT05_16555 [Chitinophagaceae bacterium]